MSIEVGDDSDPDGRLDRLLVLYMQSVSRYLTLANSLEVHLAGGRLRLSKTRCSAMPAAGGGGGGSACLGQLQYCEADMRAASSTVEIVDNSLSVSEDSEADLLADDFSLAHSPEAGNRAMRWFAALPPPSLRAAKHDFESALPLIVALANEKARLLRLDSRMGAIKASYRSAALEL